MPTWEAHLVAQHANALVIVHLTRRSDLRVAEIREEAFDLLATVCKSDRNQDQWFGIQVRATLPASMKGEFVRHARRGQNNQERRIPIQTPFPICEMLVDVVSDDIHWRWLLEPVCEEAGKRLRTNQDTTLTPLTNEAVNTIVDAVNCWHGVD